MHTKPGGIKWNLTLEPSIVAKFLRSVDTSTFESIEVTNVSFEI
jgi:hypothetical protein